MKKNDFEEMTPKEKRILIAGGFGCLSALFLFCIALAIAVIILSGEIYARKTDIPQPTTLIYSPSGQIYHHGDTVDLNDFLYQFDPETDWNHTELYEDADSVLKAYGVYVADSINGVWKIK